MRDTAFEYRYRLPILCLVVGLGFFSPGLISTTVWMYAAGWFAHQHWLTIQASSLAVGEAAAAFALLAAIVRTWAAAVRGKRSIAAVATEIHCVALAIFMPLYGAAFTVLVTGILTARILLAEQASAQIFPIAPWKLGRALRSELYFWAAFVAIAALVPQFNGTRILQGILASGGLALIVKGLWPTPAEARPQLTDQPSGPIN
jgi:hypothetical protein